MPKILAYSRKIHDKRAYNQNVYKAAIPEIVKALFKEELNEARRGIRFINGHYYYKPSASYTKMLNKTITKTK